MIYDLIIIGFGIAGISIAKEAVKRNKKILILEKESNFGGVWYNAHNNCELQTHKTFYEFREETTMSNNIRHYPTKKILINYLENIVKNYDLNKYTKFNFLVDKLENIDDLYKINNKYISKFICICCGINNNIKKIDNLNNYPGNVIYSKHLRCFDFNKVKNKNILVIGNGASACDIIKNIDEIDSNNKITCIYKRPKYYIDKFIIGLPISLFLNELVLLFFKKIHIVFYRLIVKIVNLIFFGNVLDIPFEKINSRNLVGSTIINKKIMNGSIIYLKDNIKFIHKNNIILSNNILLNIDYIFCCNGYNNYLTFLGNIPKKRYLGIFHKNYKNIGFIGYNPSYNFPKICEKQSILFLNYMDNKFKINKYYENKIRYNEDYTYNLYDYLKL